MDSRAEDVLDDAATRDDAAMKRHQFPTIALTLAVPLLGLLWIGGETPSGEPDSATVLPLLMLLVTSEFGFIMCLAGVVLGIQHGRHQGWTGRHVLITVGCAFSPATTCRICATSSSPPWSTTAASASASAGCRATWPARCEADRAAGRRALLPQVQLLRRVRLRLGLGRCLSARRPTLLPEAGHRLALHAGHRGARAHRRFAPAAELRRGADRGLGPGRRAARACPGCTGCSPRRRDGWMRAGADAAARLPVPLAQPRLRAASTTCSALLGREAQEDQARAPPRRRGRRPHPPGARRRGERRRVGDLPPAVRGHLRQARRRADADAAVLPRDRPHHGRQPAAGAGRARRARSSPPPSACRAAHLYGRHWGCSKEFHSLHFEACYYQGLEHCIEQGSVASSPAPRASTRSRAASCPCAPGPRTGSPTRAFARSHRR
jgi:hypothetical protein